MAELLIKAVDAVHVDVEKDRAGCYKKGYIVDIRPDGFLWGNKEQLPKFVIVKCPEATPEECNSYKDSWKDDFVFNIESQNAAQGRYTVRVQSNAVSVTGSNQITLSKIDSFLTSWGCNNISFTAPYVQFDFRLAQAIQSGGFWDVPNIAEKVNFTVISYNSTTGVGRIQAVVTDSTITAKQISSRITEREGTIVSSDHQTFIFDIERSSLFAKFKTDIKAKSEKIFCRRKYCFLPTDVDTAISMGGTVTLTKAQILSRIKNKLDE
jgi:hypothetical protein